jgi:hypothetical protein
MSFIQIGFAFALAALAVPIIVHLVFRQRAKRVDLGTLRFLKIVLEHNARRRRVMRWLLLSLRLGAVALLAFLFMRPFWLSARPGGEKQTVVVLIDRSATMELKQDGQRAIERAVAESRKLIELAPDNARFEIAWFDHGIAPLSGEPETQLTSAPPATKAAAPAAEKPRADLSRRELLKRLVAPEACYGATDFGVALEWARDVLAKAPPGPRRLHVFTDFQQSGLAWSEVDALPDDVHSHLHDLGRAAVNNVAVIESRLERAWLRPGEQTALHVSIYNGGPFTTAELPVTLSLKSGTRKLELKEQVKVEPGTAESLRFDLPPLDEGSWTGTVSVQSEDDLPLDNQRHVAILAAQPYQVLIVDGRWSPSPVLCSTYFLEAALRLAPEGEVYAGSPFEPRTIASDERLPDLEKYDAVVLSDAPDLAGPDARDLAAFVERGGGLIVFTGENLTAERIGPLQAAGLTVGTLGPVQHSTDLPLRLKTWDSRHPIFTAFSDPQLGDLQRLSFSAFTTIQPLKDAQVLASFRDGKPAVIERRRGQGSIVWVATTPDRRWSDWTRSRLYLPLMHQLLGHQTGLLAGGRVRQLALESTLERRPIEALAPGIHERSGHQLVVNMSPRESETDRSGIQDFSDRFGLKVADEAAAVAAPPPRVAGGSELVDSEIWPWLATLLLATLLVEGLVANRTTA